MLAWSGASSQAAPASQPPVKASEALAEHQGAAPPPSGQEQGQSPCQSCHPDQYAEWQTTTHADAALDPVFQEQLAKSHDQEACLSCHTTGFDAGSGQYMSEGVTCEACHGPYKEGHPAAETMQLPMESETCRMCHRNAFAEWETSEHAQKNIECFDCHMAHTQGLRTGDQGKLCSACHTDQQTQLTHSQHGINGVDCASCHMATEMKPTNDQAGVNVEMSNHSFAIPADVCNGCHADTIHSGANASTSQPLLAAPAQPQPDPREERTTELEGQISDLNRRAATLRDLAVAGMGLTFGAGAFLGLVIGGTGVALWLNRRGS